MNFKHYKWGIDYLAALLFALLILPMIVYWCIPSFAGIWGNTTVGILATVCEFLGAVCMIALFPKERRPFAFFTLTGTLSWLFLLLDYVAWIFFFCAFNNVAVRIFLAVCPCVSLLAFQAGRKNYFAIVPTAAFAFFEAISAILLLI